MFKGENGVMVAQGRVSKTKQSEEGIHVVRWPGPVYLTYKESEDSYHFKK